MKRVMIFGICLMFAVVLASCVNPVVSNPPTINGTWTLATVQSVPAASVGYFGTMVVTVGSSYTETLGMTSGVYTGDPMTGTVALQSGSVYRFLDSDGTSYIDYTLSADGHTISGSSGFLGLHTFTK